MRILSVLALLLICFYAEAAVDGDIKAPYPSPLNSSWFDTTNDGVVSLRHHDDGLSAQARAAGHLSYLTYGLAWDLDTDVGRKLRADQLTLVLGRHVSKHVALLGGFRLTGDLGGQDVQSSFHHSVSNQVPSCDYSKRLACEPVAIIIIDTRIRPTILGVREVASVSPSLMMSDTNASVNLRESLEVGIGFVALKSSNKDVVVREVDRQRRGLYVSIAVQLMHIGYGLEYGQHECLGRVGVTF